ncbi:CPBP family intramembrane glutamic endopeptidase [Ekhidna sp.]|uniref:CPBP family intramembrane glutamic endopeptidase n=1 Tax=Ekhidna sp. TaxID=2608089 RepID=UPI003296C5DF
MSSINFQKVETIAVIITALGKFLFYDILDQRLVFILLMFTFWGSYVFWRIRKSPDVLREWGFRRDNFQIVLKKVLPFGILAILACFIIGFFRDTINPHWHIIPILLAYPIFGTLQQFLLMSLVAGNMQAQKKYSNEVIILTTSALFGLLHYPYGWLIIGTFILSLFYTYIFLKHRNLYVLGIFHGWLGAVFYYTVVNKDPFVEVFGPLFN